jgi:hypothetical protein
MRNFGAAATRIDSFIYIFTRLDYRIFANEAFRVGVSVLANVFWMRRNSATIQTFDK